MNIFDTCYYCGKSFEDGQHKHTVFLLFEAHNSCVLIRSIKGAIA